jgi:exoribonuclease R
VTDEGRFTYEEAAQNFKSPNPLWELVMGRNIAHALRASRHSPGTALSDLSVTRVSFSASGDVKFVTDSSDVREMKQMIEEFAIMANTYVGSYLAEHATGAMYRTCGDTTSGHLLGQTGNAWSAQDFMSIVVKNGISAAYEHTPHPHDLVGSKQYAHFTSPIRRFVDCICHYLLKSILSSASGTTHTILQNIPTFFTNNTLREVSCHISTVTKIIRNVQRCDNKLRMLQAMFGALPVYITFSVQEYVRNTFVNLTITNVFLESTRESFPIYYPYSIYLKHASQAHVDMLLKQSIELPITQINLPISPKRDQGTLPELEHYVLFALNPSC